MSFAVPLDTQILLPFPPHFSVNNFILETSFPGRPLQAFLLKASGCLSALEYLPLTDINKLSWPLLYCQCYSFQTFIIVTEGLLRITVPLKCKSHLNESLQIASISVYEQLPVLRTLLLYTLETLISIGLLNNYT